MYEKIKKWYEQGLWTAEMVQNAVEKGVISYTEYCELIGEHKV